MNQKLILWKLSLVAIFFVSVARAAPVTFQIEFDGSGNGPAGSGTLIYDAALPPRERIIELSWNFGNGRIGSLDTTTIFGVPEEVSDIMFSFPVVTRQTVDFVQGDFQQAVFCGALNTIASFCTVSGGPAYRIVGNDGQEYSGFTTLTFSGVTTYDPNADWSNNQNPNGVWTYTGNNGAVLSVHQPDWDPSGSIFSGQSAWANSTFPNPGHVPMWFKSAGESMIDVQGIGMHGSEGFINAWVGIVWRSPATGKIDVSGGVWQALKTENDGFGGNHLNRNSDWRLRLNNTVLASGNVSGTDGFSSSSPFPLALGTTGTPLESLPVEPGDELILEFISPNSFATFNGIDLVINANRSDEVINAPPTADAGPDQAVRAGDTVFLDGSASFDDNTPTESLGYSWSFSSFPAGSNAVLQGADSASPTFFVDFAGTYSVQLVVTDGGGLASTPDEVIISSDNLAPTADAGLDQLVIVNSTVFLDGSGSTDPEADPLSYSWVISSAPAGSSATLAGDNTVSPNFTPDLEGAYEITLTASDLIGPSAPDSVNITSVYSDEFAVISIVSADQTVITLDPSQVTTAGNQNALGNFLSQATVAIQSGEIAEAIDKLQKAISRTDGCVLRGDIDMNGPGRDWITDCTTQVALYESLNQALAAISP